MDRKTWPVILEQLSCETGEAQGTLTTKPVELDGENPFCLQASFFVPGNAPQGERRSLIVKATALAEDEDTEQEIIETQITNIIHYHRWPERPVKAREMGKK